MRHIMKLIIVTLIAVGILFQAHQSFSQDKDGPNVPKIFNEKKVLTGGIHVDFSIVSLPKYQKNVNDLFDYSFTETEKIAKAFNGGASGSDLKRLEEAAGSKEQVKVSPEAFALINHAKEIADWTRGAFDPVRGPGNYKNLKINKKNSTVLLTKPGLSLDLSNILEGFMADLFIRAANAANIENAFVRVNGVSRALGRATYGPWAIQITGYGDSYAKHGRRVSISGYSAAMVGGETPSPTVDPRTGKEVDSSLYSVTVITKEGATSQGVANSVYVMGPKEGKDLIDSLGIRAILAFRDGSMKQVGRW